MHILIVSAGGLSQKLTRRRARAGNHNHQEIRQIGLLIVVKLPAQAASFTCEKYAYGSSDTATIERLIYHLPYVIFHLAAIVSGEAEIEFGKDHAVNPDGTRKIFGQSGRLEMPAIQALPSRHRSRCLA